MRNYVANLSIRLILTYLLSGVKECHCSFNWWSLLGMLCSWNWASARSRYVWTIIGKEQVRRLLFGDHSGIHSSPSMLFIWESTTCALWSPAPKWKGQIVTAVGTMLRVCYTQSIWCLPLKYETVPPAGLNLGQKASTIPKLFSFLESLPLTTCSLASTVKSLLVLKR